MKKLMILASLLLAACGQKPPVNTWYAGPIIRGENYSQDVKLQPAGAGWQTTLSGAKELDGALITKPPITAGSITVSYTISGGELYPTDPGASEPYVTVFLQKGGDAWSGKGQYAGYRWYSARALPATEGTHTATISLTDNMAWVNYAGAAARDVPGFQQALASTGTMGLGFGHWGGRMHGVRSRTTTAIRLNDWRFGE